jgi:hypothetical protein
MTEILSTEYGQCKHSTAVRYFNSRPYHVLTTFTTLTRYPAYRGITQSVFINTTQLLSFRHTVVHVRGFLPSKELEPPF